MLLTVNPPIPILKPLLIAATVDGPGATGNADYGLFFTPEEAKWIYQRLQVAVGYTIEGIGFARIQYIGDYDHLQHAGDCNTDHAILSKGVFSSPGIHQTPVDIDDYSYWDHERRIEGAFALTMLENMGVTIDIGGKLYIPATGITGFPGNPIEYSYWNPGNIAVGARVSLLGGALGLAANIDAQIYGQNTFTKKISKYEDKLVITKPFGMGIHVTPTYNFGAFTMGADLGWNMASEVNWKWQSSDPKIKDGDGVYELQTHDLGIGLFAELPLGNGFVGIGAGLGIYGIADVENSSDKVKVVFNLPIFLSYNF